MSEKTTTEKAAKLRVAAEEVLAAVLAASWAADADTDEAWVRVRAARMAAVEATQDE